jgi:hypothetical protein
LFDYVSKPKRDATCMVWNIKSEKKKWERKYEKCRKQRRLYQIKQNKKKNQQKYIKKTHKIEVLETEGLSEQKNVSPVMKIKQTAISQFSFFC